MVAQLRLLLDQADSTSGLTNWTNAQLRTALSIGQRQVGIMIGGIEKDTTIKLVGKQVSYNLPSDFQAIEAVFYVKNYNYNPLAYKADKEFGIEEGTDTTKWLLYNKTLGQYTTHNNKLKVYPIGSMYSNDSLKVDYYGLPATLTSDTMTSQLPEYTELLVYKIAEYVLKNDDFTVSEETTALQNLDLLKRISIDPYVRRKAAVPTLVPGM